MGNWGEFISFHWSFFTLQLDFVAHFLAQDAPKLCDCFAKAYRM